MSLGGRGLHLHDHLIAPEAQRLSRTLYDDCRTQSTENIGLPLLGGIQIVTKHIVLVWQLRPADRAHPLCRVLARETDSVGAFEAVMVAAVSA